MIEIDGQSFDWDEKKHEANISRHGVSFREAATVFLDPYVLERYDFEHSEFEERFIAIGISRKLNLLTVCHCFRDDGGTIRIISARKATRREAELYGGV